MAKIKNPQEFFEVFKSPQKEEKALNPPVAPKEALRPEPPRTSSGTQPSGAARPAAPAPIRAMMPRGRNAEVVVLPGKVTITLSHTGLVFVVAFLAGLLVLVFCLGSQYAKRAHYIAGKSAEEPETGETSQLTRPKLGTERLPPALDMSPAASGKPASGSGPAVGVLAPGSSVKKGYCLQLISGIPKENAEEIAKGMSVNWATEVVKTGNMYGVRIGYWDSPSDVSAQRAQAHFKKDKQFKDCYFTKVESR